MTSSPSHVRIWRRRGLLIALCLVAIFLYCYRLSNMPSAQLAPAEQSTMIASDSLHTVLHDPLYAPLAILRYITTHLLSEHASWALRLPTVLVGLMSLAAMFYIVRRWYGPRSFWFGAAILICSAWFLHVARLGTNDIAYLAAIPLMLASGLALYEYPERKITLLLWALVLALALYFPGLVWLVVATVIWHRKEAGEALGSYTWLQKAGLLALAAIILAPFVYGAVQQHSIHFIVEWLGAPNTLASWHAPFKNLAAAVAFVFVRTPADPTRWLGKLPLLDAFLALGFVAGLLFYAKHFKAARTRLLLLYGLIGLALCAAGGAVSRSILVPIIYLVAIGGIAYLLHEWLRVFPRNPLARRLGIGLVCVAIALSCVYSLRQYFVAWPHNNATEKTFVIAP